MKLAVHCCI